MSKETRKAFAEGLRARRQGAVALIGGDEAAWLAWAMRCSMAGPVGRLP